MGQAVQNILVRVFKLPVGRQVRALLYERLSSGRTHHSVFEFVQEAVQHQTHKAAALLGAQGIFVIVSTYAMDHGWPKGVALAAIFMLLGASLLIMSMLVSTGNAFLADPSDVDRQAIALLLGRTVRFNLALYLTFASIVLLAVGAVALI